MISVDVVVLVKSFGISHADRISRHRGVMRVLCTVLSLLMCGVQYPRRAEHLHLHFCRAANAGTAALASKKISNRCRQFIVIGFFPFRL